ncbi:MAG TPA: GtrA family protein [Methylocella sp.]|nr:GtrA family protein [Methylocella sp.]
MIKTDAPLRQSLSAHVIFTRYVIFAILAGLTNLASQEIVVRSLPAAPIMVSILTGTAVGFIAKYLLDKRWIFFDGYDSHTDELRKITVYGLFGIATTLLFWGVELGFWHLWQTVEAKYFGAAIGLALGNWIKYQLDKEYVFKGTAHDAAFRLGPLSDH